MKNKLTNKERYEVFFLDVDIKEIKEVKDLGARWDKEYKKWYVPAGGDKQLFFKWWGVKKGFFLSKSPLDNPMLYVDLVPATTWYSNLCKTLKKKDWDKIRKIVYQRAGEKCEICEGVGTKDIVHAHERWEYDDEKHIQKLIGISCLCPKCHRSTHLGFSHLIGLYDASKANLQWINRWNSNDVKKHIDLANKKWEERSGFDWVVDVTWLKNSGFEISDGSIALFEIKGDVWNLIPKE